jgi:hypothetical protein
MLKLSMITIIDKSDNISKPLMLAQKNRLS